MAKQNVKKRPTTRAERRAKAPVEFDGTFRPKFLRKADKRQRSVRIILDRVKRLRKQANCNGDTAKQLLIDRCAFLSMLLETREYEALHGGEFDAGVWVQSVNTLTGLLRKIGIKFSTEEENTLESYLDEDDA